MAEEKELPEKQKARIRSLSREYEGILRATLQQAVEESFFRGIDVPMTAHGLGYVQLAHGLVQ